MKVVHVITNLEQGGAETMLLRLLRRMDRNRFENEVVSLMDQGVYGPQILDLGVPVHKVGMTRGVPRWRDVRTLRALARRLKPDVLQGWMYHGNLAASTMAWFLGSEPAVVWNIRHTLSALELEKRTTRAVIGLGGFLSSRPAAIVHNSELGVEQHARMGYPANKAVLIPNGFDLEEFRPRPTAPAILRRELGIPGDAAVVGVLARRHPLKGHPDFLRAFLRVGARFPDLHAVLVGRGLDGPDAELAAILESGPGAERVHFLGPRPEPARLLAGLDVLCLPSLSEGFPNVMGEAMACGIPCVTTDVGQAGAILGDLGRPVPPGRPDLLARALEDMLDRTPEERAALGVRCRERIRERYDIERIVRRYEELYVDGS